MACIMISMFILYALHRKYTVRCTFSVKYETTHHRILFQDKDVFGRLLGSPHSPPPPSPLPPPPCGSTLVSNNLLKATIFAFWVVAQLTTVVTCTQVRMRVCVPEK